MGEFQAMKQIGAHENIIQVIEFCEMAKIKINVKLSETIEYLALSFAENESLLDVLNERENKFSEKWVRYWFRQILKGIKHIHS